MSLIVTLLLVLCAVASVVVTLKTIRGFSGNDAFYGLLLGFITAVAADFYFGFPNDCNGGRAILAGVIAAVFATPLWTTFCRAAQSLYRRIRR